MPGTVLVFLCVLCASVVNLSAGKKQLVAPNSPEEIALMEALRGDAAQRVAQLDAFVQKFPQTAAAAYAHHLSSYIELQQWDKALDYGKKAFEADSEDADVAVNLMKAAQGKGDTGTAVQWGTTGGGLMAKDLAARPADMDDEAWKSRQAVLRAYRDRLEYDTFVLAQAEKDPARRAGLMEQVGVTFAGGTYGKLALVQAAVAYQQAGNVAKMAASAENALKADPGNETMHLLLAQTYLDQKNLGPALQEARSVLKLFETKAKPEAMADADWANYQKNYRGVAQSISGQVLMQQEKTAEAVPELKSASDLLAGNPQALAPVLYNLAFGYAKLKRLAEARTVLQRAVQIPGPYQKLSQDLAAKIKAPAP